jgi:hypothetical protein
MYHLFRAKAGIWETEVVRYAWAKAYLRCSFTQKLAPLPNER